MYKLILVDDEINIRKGMEHSIPWSEWGYEIAGSCENGLEAVALIQTQEVDVVLSDIRMPQMDGIDLMKYINEKHSKIKVIILSGYNDFKYLNTSIKNNVTDYLLKPTDMDEFEALFIKIKKQLDEERQTDKENLESTEQHLFVWLGRLLYGYSNERNITRFDNLLVKYHICFDNMRVVVLSIDGCAGDDKNHLHQMKRGIIKSCNENCDITFFLAKDENIVGIYSDSREEENHVLAVVHALQKHVKERGNGTISIGISDFYTDIISLPEAYAQAKCCVNQNIFNGKESVFSFSQLTEEKPHKIQYFNTQLIEKHLMANDYDQMCTEVGRVLDDFIGAKTKDYRFVDTMCLSLLFHVALWCVKYDVILADILKNMGTDYMDIYLCDTLHKKKEFLMALLFAVQLQLEKKLQAQSGTQNIAYQLRACVDSEYQLNAMSLEYVAERIKKSPSYVSKIFKTEMGCGFSDYLTQKRMSKAIGLLTNPEMKVYEIAEQCGYANVSSFIKVFRKNYEKSPNEYRNEMGCEL